MNNIRHRTINIYLIVITKADGEGSRFPNMANPGGNVVWRIDLARAVLLTQVTYCTVHARYIWYILGGTMKIPKRVVH